MNIKKLTLKSRCFPEVLRHIPQPPQMLYHAGTPLDKLLARPRVTLVGTRSISAYGQRVTRELAGRLAEQGIVIVSGLALGVDELAHRVTLEAGGLAIAVLPSPLQRIVPATNRDLAQSILDQGGALVSEYAKGTEPFKQNFIARNRLMSGLGQAVLIIEAGAKSGAIHTANFALQQGKAVLAVPGNISNIGSVGTNNLIKSGAALVTSYQDVMHALGLNPEPLAAGRPVQGRNRHEQLLLDLMQQGITDGEELLQCSNLPASAFNQALTMLEIGGQIRPLGANHWSPYV
jgi:DNA processing protein